MGAPSDRELLERLRRREPAAYDRLYDLFSHRAFGLALRILGDPGLAEDAVQDAFLSIWQHAERLDPQRGNLAALILAVVHHKASDISRRRAKDRRPSPLQEESIAGSQAADPAETAIRESDRAVIRHAMSGLPRDQRRALQLAYLAGQTQAEIAATTNWPLGTVKSRMRLALRRLRHAFNPGVER